MALVDLDCRTKHIKSGRDISLEFNIPELETQYPGDWFINNPNKKPSVTVPKCTKNEADLFAAVKGGIFRGSLSLKTAKIYIRSRFPLIKDVLVGEWTSYKVTIARSGAEVTPLSLIDIVEGKEHTPTELVVDGLNWSHESVLFYLLSIYRVCRVINTDYRDSLENRLKDKVSALGGVGMNYGGISGLYGAWSRDTDYNKLIAAIDMFLYKFKNSEFSIYRMATLGSRMRDCAGLACFGYARNILGATPKSIIEWVFVKAMVNEIFKLTGPEQEVTQEDSYFPYQSDFRLVERSSYSSVANPNFFHWIHMIGALLGNKRSINARYTFKGNVIDLTVNAALLVWAYGRGAEVSQLSSDVKDYSKIEEKEVTEDVGDLGTAESLWMTTTGRDPATWFGILASSNFRLPKCVTRMIVQQQEKIRDPRPGTIGEYVKHQLTY